MTPGSLARICACELRVKLLQRRLSQIDDLRQIQAVELLEMMPQRRVHLGFGRRRLEHIVIAHALLPRELDRQQQQRRIDPFLRRLLQVVPVQKRDHEPQLREAVLRAIAPRVGDDLVERAREIRLILEPQPATEDSSACTR